MKNPTYSSKLIFSLLFFLETYFKKIFLFLFSIFRVSRRLHLSSHLLKQRRTAYKLVLFFALLASTNAFSQLAVPFSPRLDGGNIKVKGDIVFIGNSIIAGEGYTLPYNGSANNNNTEGIYINVESGGDPSVFSSSSAGLAISSSCKQVVYAGLYWASVYPYEESTNPNTQFDGTPRFEDWNEIKFRLPTGGFIDLVADDNPDSAGEEDDIIFDGYQYYGSTPQQSFKDSPIICYKNVTNLLQSLGEANGDYTVANLRAARGRRTGGCSAGWTLVVIYEDPTLPSKYITTFDGYAGVQGSTTLDIPVSGYQTLPIPFPVRANIGVGALEGDVGIRGDSFQFKATTSPGTNYTALSDAVNPANNFFNSNISLNGVQNTNRNPASLNTLGMDINNVLVPNPSNTVIPNDSSSGDLRLTTSGDGYGAFVAAFAVEIIEPTITLTKIVEDDSGNDVGNQTVGLGQALNYVIGFQNTGNEDAVNFTIRDILPLNIVFNYPADLVLPAGVTVVSYNPATREIIFNIEDYLVEIGDPVYEIRIETEVVQSCSLLADACSDIINNQAFATYGSALDPSFIISDDPSYSTNTGCLIIPQATNFLANLDDCVFTQNETLCGASLELTAANGYDSYSWSTSPSGTPVIGTTQTITVTSPGTYYSFNTAIAPCQSIEQEYVVTNFGNTVNNPVIPYADEVVICPNDGKELPNIYLCGANDSTLIETGISDASSIIWEQLDETSCAPVIDSDCANENSACTWNQVGTGPDFLANTSGQFRLTLNYAGGCFNQFYFNVYQNLLAPAVTATDIICTTPGSITVTGVPNGYEYSLDGTTYQSSNVFSITAAGLYTVYIRQIGVDSNPCVFTVPDIQIRARNFTVSTTVTQPLCNGDLGNIQLAANDVDPQYFFSIYQGATLINSIGPITENNYTFGNLNPGTYTVNVETEDGCTYTEDVEIIEPALLTATSALTMPLTCTDGEITVYPVGGTAPYFYFVNSTTDFQTVPEIVVTAAGTYNITVVDSNNCVANTSITVEATPAPEYTISSTDILCADAPDSGSITITVTNANGNSLAYSIDGGATFSNGSVFTGLTAGNYDVVVEYTLGSDVCLTDPQPITIAGATPITGTATLTTPYTCTSNGTISVTGVSGGIAPYSYSIDGVTFQVGNTFTGLTDGTYTITVQDANNCTSVVGTITIDPLDPPTDLMFSNTALTCPSNTSDVTITTTGGTPTLEYQIIAPAGAATPYQASNVFTGLAPGTYTFQVNDANACTYSESYTITALPALTVVGQNLNDITCFGDLDGSIQFTVSGSTGFNYTLNGGASTAGTSPLVLTGLGAGSYTIVVTDTATNCDATATLTVNAPPAALAMTTTVSPITCLDNGSVVINATGGWGSNMYSLTLPDSSTLGPQTSNTFVNLTQVGTYIATVVDANGCTVTDTFDLTAPTGPVASISAASDLCYDATNGATLEVTASGGVAPYEYNINGGAFQSSNIFTNVVPGTYTIIVRDAYGCEVTLTSQTIAPQLTLSTVITKDLDCTASPDAVITGTITGGYAPFTYAVSINSGAYTSLGTTGSPFTYTTGTAGTYQFQVTDAEGCIAESGITTIAGITSPTATATPVAPLCFNGTNGEVQLFASGGSGGYTFSFDGSAFTTQSLYTNLSANISYTYQVQDSNACLSPVYTITLTNPTEVEAAATIPANTTCSATTVITVTATGGTGSYSYSFEGGAYSSTNTYTVTNTTTTQTITYSVRDTNGCIDTETIDIPPYNPVTGMTFSDTAITCNNTTTDVTITPTGGVAPFTFVITAPAVATGNTTGATTGIFTGLTPGNYTFEVTDANGCSVSASHVIAPATNIVVSGTKTDEVCFGASDGQAIFTITDVSSPGNFTYTISPASGTATQTGDIVTVTGLAAGTYTIDVTDITTGCVDSASVTINAATEINFTVAATNVNCNNPISTISFPTLTGGSPGYTYAYVSSGDPAPALGAYSNATTVDTSVLGLNIDVYVKDTNDCVVMIPVTIISDPTPTVTLAVDNQCTASGSNYTITASASSGVAPYTYSIDGINFQTSATFTVSPGTYTVTVRDANACTAVSNTVTVYPQLTLNTVITKDLDCTASPDAIITGTINGGSSPFTYSVSINSGGYTSLGATGSPFTYSTSTAGTYQFQVTDANGCTAESVINTIDALVPVTTANTFVDPTCNGDTNGSITLNATSGDAPFTYSIDGGATFVASNVFGGLSAGTYNYVVRDSKACEASGSITLTDPAPIIASIDSNPIVCNLNTQGSFDVTITSGGVANFTYILYDNSYTQINTSGSTSLTTHSFTGLTFGDYYISIVDANGCEFNSTKLRIETPPILTLTATVDSNNCSTGVDITVNTSGGNPDFIFSIFGQSGTASAPQTSPNYTFNGLLHNTTYFLQVEDDANCISVLEVTTPNAPSNIEIVSIASSNANCNGGNDGTLDFTVQNYDPTVTDLTYSVLNALSLLPLTGFENIPITGPPGGPISETITGLPAGNYVISVTEVGGTLCSANEPFQITQPFQPLDANVTGNVNANCNTGAQVTVTATGGTGPYQYAYAPSPTVPTVFNGNNVLNLDPALGLNWNIIVRDANGCEFALSVIIAEDALPTIDPVAAQCYVGSPLNITLSGTTYNGTATYSIGGPFQSSPNFTLTTPGTYTLSIQDDNGCVATTSYVVNTQLVLSAALTQALDCTASPDAEITLTATGGDTASYSYEVSTDGGATYSPMATNVYTASTAGTYTFSVTDAAGCEATTTYVLDPIPAIVFTTVETDVSCNGGSDGTITVTVTGGSGPFQYQLDGGTIQNSNIFTGLSQGTTYVITVIDAQSCTQASAPITINEPTVLSASATVSVNTTCDVETLITVTGQDGTPTGSGTGYYYNFNGLGYTTTNTYTVNNNGTVQTVTYTVRDANGCEVSGSVSVDPLNPPTDLDFSATAITCLVSTSDVTLTTTNGVTPLSYEILSPSGATTNTTGASSGIFTGLPADDYIFQVTDANGCTYQELYTVADVENITVTGQLISDVTCNPGANGEVLFTISNFAGTYSYSINGAPAVTGQTSPTVTVSGLTGPSTQTIEVTDETTGCTATTSIDVAQPAALGLTLDTNINATCNMGAQVSVIASGGVTPYSYSFVVSGSPAGPYSSSNTAILDPAVSTTWDVYVQDGNSCVITTPLTITIATDPIPSGITISGLSQCPSATNDYTFTVNVGSGVGPYEYSIGNGFQTSPTFTVNASGSYTVTVRDANGCTNTAPVNILPALEFSAAITTLPSCSDDDGEISVTGSGGSGTYGYTISPNPGSITFSGNVFSGVPSGTYTVTMTDTTTGCTEDISLTLGAATPVTFTTSVNDVSCNGGSDGVITVTLPASNDNPVYTYEITAPIVVGPQNSNVFAGLPAGTYTVQVNSGRGCLETADVVVGEPVLLDVSATATDFACAANNSVNTSTITITETGGTAPYTYSINGTNYFTTNIFDISDTGSVQNFTVYVQDANGCIATNTVTIAPLPVITDAIVTTNAPIDCNTTGSVIITVTGGSGNFTYQMLPNGTAQISNIFAITAPGTYYFQVNDLDTGCTFATAPFTVAPFDTVDAVATATTPVTCFGDTNGTLEINVSGYTGNYTYEVFDASGTSVGGVVTANTATNPQVITGLSGGNYTVEVVETDSPFCTTISNTVTISSPPSALTVTATETSNVTCTNTQGTINAVASGGWGNYQYELTGAATVAYSTNGTFEDLSAGTYTVNVIDSGGCIASATVTLDEPTPITATFTASTTMLPCFGDTNASITVSNVTGGQGSNYVYILNTTSPVPSASGPQSSPVFDGLGAGTYSVSVTDAYSCLVTSVDIVIAPPTQVEASLVVNSTQSCLTESTLTLNANGGTGPYTYSEDSTFTTVLGSFVSSTTFSVPVGTYSYYVQDANGCISNVSNDITIEPLPTLVLNLVSSNPTINCAGDNTGMISATAEGGLGNYVYTLEDTSGNPIPATQNSPGVFTELVAGTYVVHVDSGDCESTTAPITITEPDAPLAVTFVVTDVQCFGANNGTIEITATGGTGIIKYAISPQLNQFFETNIFDNLSQGTYDVIVQDELGCYEIINFTVSEPAAVILNIVANSIIPEVCEGDNDGEFSIELSGGTEPYSVSLDDYNGVYTVGAIGQTQFDFTGLAGGDHIVYVRDSASCESEWNITFPESVRLAPEVVIDYTCIDNAAANTVSVTVDESITDLTDVDYSLDGAAYQASNVFINVAVGVGHYIDVRHTNGCIVRTELFDIIGFAPLTLTLSQGGLNEIVAEANGGATPYQFTLNGEDYGSTSSFIIYASGVYTVIVTDNNGCTAEAEIPMEFIDVCIPNYFTPNGDGVADGWGPGCAEIYRNLEVDIFDRYGRKVAVLRVGEYWDGKYEDKELPTGDYWYVVKLNSSENERDFVGHFTLYR